MLQRYEEASLIAGLTRVCQLPIILAQQRRSSLQFVRWLVNRLPFQLRKELFFQQKALNSPQFIHPVLLLDRLDSLFITVTC